MSTIVVTGGAGFVGSHLCEALLARGYEVICVDDLSTGLVDNLADFWSSPDFTFIEADITKGLHIDGPVDAIAHLASAASPPEYLARPLETLAVGSHGAEAVLELARTRGARALLASTSEIYGDPAVHPQPETYWGNVNSIGPRSVYDEAKRFSEALFMAYHRHYGTDVGIVRIFNTYGPRLRPNDGRVVSNFIAQALAGEPLTIFGSGEQTRSFCYVDDLVRGLIAMLESDHVGPVNLGNPIEKTVTELGSLILELTNSVSTLTYEPLPTDDPRCRRPDITRAGELLGWKPEVDLEEGLRRTIEWQRGLAMTGSEFLPMLPIHAVGQ
jgi:dTDP-glucose 4,6-dehydratase